MQDFLRSDHSAVSKMYCKFKDLNVFIFRMFYKLPVLFKPAQHFMQLSKVSESCRVFFLLDFQSKSIVMFYKFMTYIFTIIPSIIMAPKKASMPNLSPCVVGVMHTDDNIHY